MKGGRRSERGFTKFEVHAHVIQSPFRNAASSGALNRGKVDGSYGVDLLYGWSYLLISLSLFDLG